MKPSLFRSAIAAAVAAGLLAACGPSVERAFSNCSEAVYKQSMASNKGRLPPELARNFEKAARATAEEKCDFIRDECRRDPQSVMCQRLVQQYGK
jgi:hypothetical protein